MEWIKGPVCLSDGSEGERGEGMKGGGLALRGIHRNVEHLIPPKVETVSCPDCKSTICGEVRAKRLLATLYTKPIQTYVPRGHRVHWPSPFLKAVQCAIDSPGLQVDVSLVYGLKRAP